MLGRGKKPAVGQFVEFQQAAVGVPTWLPFLVTHVHDGDLVSGVCFTGMPGAVGWNNRAAQAFNSVSKGSGNSQWRFKRGRQPSDDMTDDHEQEDPMPMDEAPAEDAPAENDNDMDEGVDDGDGE